MSGIIRRASTSSTRGRLEPIYTDPHSLKSRLFLHYGDLSDASGLARLMRQIQPDEIYNLAAQSHVRVSFDSPEYTADITATGTVRLLEAVRESGIKPRVLPGVVERDGRQGAGCAADGGNAVFIRAARYGCAKVFSYWITVNYRESYGLHASNGILFNHESPRQWGDFL